MTHDVDTVLAAYVECALWSSTDNGEDSLPLDEWATADDVAPEALAAMRGDVETFLRDNAADVQALNPEQVGHDFWLTRNGHGAGFWDRGLGAVGDRLTEAAHAYGESDLYVGDDGKVYAS